MSFNTFGKIFRFTTWGESHGPAIGCVVDGCPPNIKINIDEIQKDLNKRKPGQSKFTTQRKEDDRVEILSGIFEGKSIPAFDGTNKVPEDFSFGEFPENFEHFEPYLTACMKRFPILEKVGIRKFFAGPESFTPDTNTLLGEVPEVKNFFVCCGLNSIGIASAGGVGKVTAEWLMNGHINDCLLYTSDAADE